jgi:predicted amidohydrolase
MFLAAVVQLCSSAETEANWQGARRLIERAAGYGAQLVATPENTNLLGPPGEKVRRAEPLGGPTCSRFSLLAKRLGIYLLLGSFNEEAGDPDRAYNTSVLFGPDGSVLAAYRKIHLFGRDHWEPLLRARAIECQCYVLAPAQYGRHDERGARESYGHSMILDPWGHVLARASDGTGVALAEVDLDRVARVRRAMPVAEHRKLGWGERAGFPGQG